MADQKAPGSEKNKNNIIKEVINKALEIEPKTEDLVITDDETHRALGPDEVEVNNATYESQLININKGTKTHAINKLNNVTVKGNFVRTRLSGSILKFGYLYSAHNKTAQISITVVLAIIFGILGVILLQNTGLYDYGLASIPMALGRLSYFLILKETANQQQAYVVFNILFWLLYFVANIPLIIFGYFKVGKRFTELSTYFLLVSTLTSIGFGFIPQIENFFLFSNLSVNAHQALAQYNIPVVLWNYGADSASIIGVFVYSIAYSVVLSWVYASLLIINSSTGGFDFFGMWYALKKYKDVGKILGYINLMCFLIAIIIGSYVPASIALEDYLNSVSSTNPEFVDPKVSPWSVSLLLNPNFVFSVIANLIFTFLLGIYFPKYKISKVEIYSAKVNEIVSKIKESEKPFTVSIINLTGGYSGKSQTMLVTTCMFIDSPYLLKLIRSVDKDCLVTVNFINNVDGYVYLADNNEKKKDKKRLLGRSKK
ncbi:DUF2179 domain-containing protein [Mycoplasmopsis agassizii]|uniref:DUF2179 domain-containing protein n=1 Tax=Mycoplasmopsis agassizii TaxID=33922 RepID=UPI0035289412